MATFSTHILNSLNGTHFSDIDVKLFRCTKSDKNELKHKYYFTSYVRLRATALRITPQEISRRHRELRVISHGGEQRSLGSQLATCCLRPEH